MKIIALLAGMTLTICAGAALAAEPVATQVDPAPPAKQAPPADQAPPPAQAPLISQTDLLARIENQDADLVVLDVRTPAEFAAGHVPGARNLPHDELPARLAELSSLKEKDVVLYCRSGRRTAIAVQTLRAAGFTKLLHLEGDIGAWEAAKQPLER